MRKLLAAMAALAAIAVAAASAQCSGGPAAPERRSMRPGPLKLENGGFEAGLDRARGLPAGWARPHPWRGPIAIVSSPVHRGKHSLLLRDDSPKYGNGLRHLRLPAAPGAVYRAWCWALPKTGRGWLYLEFFNSGGVRIAAHRTCTLAPGRWQRLALVAQAPPGTAAVSVSAYTLVAEKAEVYYDDFGLELVRLPQRRERGPVNVSNRRQLFIDDYFIETSRNLRFVLNPPRKSGIIFLRADKPWERLMINAWHTIMEDPDPTAPEYRYRLWYEVYWKPGDQGSALAYARSRDLIHWEKPELGLIEFQGSKQNNLVWRGTAEHGQHGGTVFIDPNAPPEERYKYVYLGGGKLCAAVSPDGIHWRPYDGPRGDVLCDWPSDTQNVAFWDPDLGCYMFYGRWWSPRMVAHARAEGFGPFGKPEVVMAPDDSDPPDTDIYNNAAVKYPWADRAYFMFPSLYHHPSDKLWVELAISRDGRQWSRPCREPFIPTGMPGQWDEGLIYRGVGLIRRGSEIWLSFYGRHATHNTYKDKRYQGAYSWAISRLDGFVSLDAGDETGELVTVPIIFSGSRLVLNVHALPGGWVRCELQDGSGKAVPGFSVNEADPIRVDSVGQTVTWRGRSNVRHLAGQPVRLRIVMRRAKLYAFEFAD